MDVIFINFHTSSLILFGAAFISCIIIVTKSKLVSTLILNCRRINFWRHRIQVEIVIIIIGAFRIIKVAFSIGLPKSIVYTSLGQVLRTKFVASLSCEYLCVKNNLIGRMFRTTRVRNLNSIKVPFALNISNTFSLIGSFTADLLIIWI